MTTLTNYYYSGQGSLYVAQRSTTTGKPLGFTRVTHCPAEPVLYTNHYAVLYIEHCYAEIPPPPGR